MSIIPFLNKINSLVLNPLILVAFSVSFLYLVYAIFNYISKEGKEREDAKRNIAWILVGLFIMVSVYGIIRLVLNTFEIPDNQATQYLKV